MFHQEKLAQTNGVSATMGLKDWLLFDCIMFLNIIPVFGSVAALVIYLILAFNGKTAPSLKYRIIASLIWCCAALVLCIILISAGLFSAASLSVNG